MRFLKTITLACDAGALVFLLTAWIVSVRNGFTKTASIIFYTNYFGEALIEIIILFLLLTATIYLALEELEKIHEARK